MFKLNISKIFFSLATIIIFLSTSTIAVTVKDSKGNFSIDYVPKRVVALEYSFVDSLANIGISPVGVADDNNKNRILSSVREKISDWDSVGSRAQPNLEAIAALKPDLIIADDNRHSGIYEQLKKIAPTLVLKSRKETYTDNLISAQIIGDVMDQSSKMEKRLKEHKDKIADYAKQIKKGIKVSLALSRENQFAVTTDESYTGDLLRVLGLEIDKSNKSGDANNVIGLEQLAKIDPDYLIIVNYREQSLAKNWEKEPLWQALKAVKNKHVFNEKDANLWTRSRGLDASEEMAEIIKNYLTK